MARLLAKIVMLTPVTTTIWLAMIASAVVLAIWAGISWLWAPIIAYLILALHELLAFKVFHRGIFPSSERVARAYEWFTLFFGDQPDLARRGDLTEGLFDGDFEKSIEQATRDKYQRIVELLDIKPGDRVLDVGCGLGEFLGFLKSHGIAGTGLTLSPDQARIGRANGLDVRVLDFRKPLPAGLKGEFDAVTLIGSLEHFNTSYQFGARDTADAVFAMVFRTASQALKPGTKSGRVFSSTLHRTPSTGWSLSDWIHAYSFHGHYSGLYPAAGDFERVCGPGFEVEHKQDVTIDYQFSSLAGAEHFGDFVIHWNVTKVFTALLLLLVNPFAPWSWVYHARHSWMWQFGGHDIHTSKPRPAIGLWYVHRHLGSACEAGAQSISN